MQSQLKSNGKRSLTGVIYFSSLPLLFVWAFMLPCSALDRAGFISIIGMYACMHAGVQYVNVVMLAGKYIMILSVSFE